MTPLCGLVYSFPLTFRDRLQYPLPIRFTSCVLISTKRKVSWIGIYYLCPPFYLFPITRPTMSRRFRHHSSSHRIHLDASATRQQVTVFANRAGMISSLPDRAGSLLQCVDIPGLTCSEVSCVSCYVQLANTPRETTGFDLRPNQANIL